MGCFIETGTAALTLEWNWERLTEAYWSQMSDTPSALLSPQGREGGSSGLS